MTTTSNNTFHFPENERLQLEPYLPPPDLPANNNVYPHTTLTFASSLDSLLTLSPGMHTDLSGSQSYSMTHYLRSRHDAILVGVNTVIAGNPSLNCRLEGMAGYGLVEGEGEGEEEKESLRGQPRPIIIDPHGRWEFGDQYKVFKLASEGKGRAPWIFTNSSSITSAKRQYLEKAGGKYISLRDEDSNQSHYSWTDILSALRTSGIKSVMIEGGAGIINGILSVEEARERVDAVILTIAPVWLGRGGVGVCPERERESKAVARLEDVMWVPLGEDVVCCARIR